MIQQAELQLKLTDARVAHMEYELMLGEVDANWSDWFAQHMVENALDMDKDELAMLIREAEVAYQNEPEQHSWEMYISTYIANYLRK